MARTDFKGNEGDDLREIVFMLSETSEIENEENENEDLSMFPEIWLI